MSQGTRSIVVFLVFAGMLSGQVTSAPHSHTHAFHNHIDAQLPHRHSRAHRGCETHDHHHWHPSEHLQVQHSATAEEGHYCPRCERCDDDLAIIFLPNLTRDRSSRLASCLHTSEPVAAIDIWIHDAPRLGTGVSYLTGNNLRVKPIPLYLRLLSIRC